MRIARVECAVISIPLREPVAFATNVIAAREYVLVWIESDEGVRGLGYTFGGRFSGGGHLIRTAVEHNLTPLLVGEDPLDSERLWERMFQTTILIGRRGAVLRAMSAVDIALWDLKGKVAGLPLSDLLGGHRETVPAYVTGGYYREGHGHTELRAEMERYLERGYRAVKVKVGRLDLRQDVERLRVVREALGPEVQLAVDANNAWPDAATAIRAARRLEPFGLWWLEEPVHPDNIAASAKIAAALDTPVATGEIEATRWGFQTLLDQQAADILQPDVTVVGGVTEWLRIAHMAAGRGLPVAPHAVANIHIHLAAAAPNCVAVECFVLEEDLVNFDRIVRDPLEPVEGALRVPQQPGHGIQLDEAAVHRFRIA